MNDVSALLSAAAPLCAPVLTELEGFLRIDPLLSGLHKEYLDAQFLRKKAEKDFGKCDPMTDMAMLVEDSAWCAMQTRYMELRADRALMVRVQAMMEEARVQALREKEAECRRDTVRQYHCVDMILKARRRQESDALAFWWIFLMFFVWNRPVFRFSHPTHQFNRLAA